MIHRHSIFLISFLNLIPVLGAGGSKEGGPRGVKRAECVIQRETREGRGEESQVRLRRYKKRGGRAKFHLKKLSDSALTVIDIRLDCSASFAYCCLYYFCLS